MCFIACDEPALANVYLSVVKSMNLYFTAAQTLDRIDNKQGSIKGILSTLPAGEREENFCFDH
jgi:hypothetical protein